MNNPASDWLVLIRPLLAGFDSTPDSLGINLREYLTEVLPKLGAWPITQVGELKSTAWKAAKAKQN